MSPSTERGSRSPWEAAGILVFAAMAIGIAIRLALALETDPGRQNVWLKVFAPAAEAFVAGADLYDPDSGFRYPPIVAAAMVPFTWLGPLGSSIVWRWVMLGLLAAGVRACMRAGFPFAMTSRERGVFWLLLVPAVIGSANIGQPNTLILGCMMLSTVAALQARTAAAATAITTTTAVKVYPLAQGLVLAVLRPRLLPWLGAGIGLALGLPFALQRPDYVAAQYHALVAMLGAEDRTHDAARAYRDLRSLCAVLGWWMSPTAFLAIQALTGAGIAALAFHMQRRRDDTRRVFEFAFSATVCWCLLLGPATERVTYALLGPTLAWPLLRTWRSPRWRERAPWLILEVLYLVDHLLGTPSRDFQNAHPWTRQLLPLTTLFALVLVVASARRARHDADPLETGGAVP